MALIENAKLGRKDGAYTRVLGNPELGALISQIHATSISAGTELERMITEKHTNVMTAEHLSLFLRNKLPNGTYLMPKPIIKNLLKKSIESDSEPDFVIIVLVDKKAYVTELKDGDTFDTKKSAAEVSNCRKFAVQLHTFFVKYNMPYDVEIRMCCFNQESRDEIVIGFKNQVKPKEVWTGRDLCKVLGISYETILRQRQEDQTKNYQFFIEELVKIDDVKNDISDLISSNGYSM